MSISRAMLMLLAAVIATALLASAEAVDELGVELALDDVCTAGEADCGVSLRQLRAEPRQGAEKEGAEANSEELEQKAVIEVSDEKTVEEDPNPPQAKLFEDDGTDALFQETDADADGQVQLTEVKRLLDRLGDLNETQLAELHGAEDADGSGGLNASEFANAMEKWLTTCHAARTSSFCSGSGMVRCCKRGFFWAKCGFVSGHHSCGGGSYHGGGAYHSNGGAYHSSGGGYHSSGGAYHSSGGGYHSSGGGYHSSGGGYHSSSGGYHSSGGAYHVSSGGGVRYHPGGYHGGGGYHSSGGAHHVSSGGGVRYHSGGYHGGGGYHSGGAAVYHAGGYHSGGGGHHGGTATWHAGGVAWHTR